jgi:glycosyltransferase involved in cell wall biosynthesis
MKIIAISVGSYPFGEAETNRHLAYLRGLAESNISVELLLLVPGRKQSTKSNLRRTTFNGVKIKYLSPLLYPGSPIIRYLNLLIGSCSGILQLICKRKDKEGKSILFLLFTSPFILLPYILLGQLLGYKIVHERTEFPFISYKEKPLLKFYLNYLIPKFDGIFVITYSLKTYFEKFTKKNIYVLPMSVESERFNIAKEIQNDNYIAYCGSMYTDKDGVPDLIYSFNLVAEKQSGIKLMLIGDNSDSVRFKFISEIIHLSPHKNRIQCTGLVDRDTIPKLLKNATILALARPDNIQANGGFPTKLGEYLSTGNPVVLTDVGEHSKYLRDGVSVCFASPGNPMEFAEKILYLINYPEVAKEIGKMGKEIAIQHFDYKSQAEKFLTYLYTI